MTDKEIAEQFADKECCETCHDIFRTCKEKCECWEFAKKGFLAGLKARKPQWHDLRKDQNDLPKEQKEYWCKVYYFESEETFNAFLWFDTNTKDFKFLEEIENSVESTFNVKEWCEIPTFDKE